MKTLEGKVAAITSSSGIVLATAKLFQQSGGARVAISGRNEKSLNAAANELGADILAAGRFKFRDFTNIQTSAGLLTGFVIQPCARVSGLTF